jgi:arginyl-tRNA synthetase
MLKLPSGKMSSRTGTVISAEDLINQVKEKVQEKAKDRNLSEATVEQIAIGALKYSILKQSIGSDIIFDFEKSVSFEGDSGPYLQYSYVRANSVLAKAKKEGVKASLKNVPAELGSLEKMIIQFPEIVQKAGRDYQPHVVALYLTELAHEFNTYYAHHKIAQKGGEFGVAVTQAFCYVMKNGLDLLGIRAPEKM